MTNKGSGIAEEIRKYVEVQQKLLPGEIPDFEEARAIGAFKMNEFPWLRSLLEERDTFIQNETFLKGVIEEHNQAIARITKESAYHENRMKDNHSQAVKNAIVIDELREELEQRTNERNEAAAHAIGWKVEAESLRSELEAKDKVLRKFISKEDEKHILATINESGE